MLTVTDLFCGGGGSSSGAVAVPGVQVRMAANHWSLAIATHNANHVETDHDCADISQVDPRRYPRTDILWASPECTNHSKAKGVRRADAQPDLFDEVLPDAAAERSRATMWDVVRFAEHHRYRAIVVENVVDAAKWVLFPAWRAALNAMGYCVHQVYLNSMHAQMLGAPAPQSRDRMYVVAHAGACPDLHRVTRPKAYCGTCDAVIEAIQVFKKPTPWGRYRQQYVYRCPNITCRNAVVEPGFLPAAAAIDWSIPGQRIGDRDRPLAAKTIARIEAGLARYFRPVHLEAGGNQYDSLDPKCPRYGHANAYIRAWPADTEALKTLHTALTKGLAWDSTMLVPVEGRDGKPAQPASDPLRTQTTRAETGVAFDPFVVELRGGGSDARPVTDPLATVTANGNHHGLLVPAGGTWNDTATSTDEPMRTRTTRETEALLVPYFRTGLATPADEPIGTLTTHDRYALVMRTNAGDEQRSVAQRDLLIPAVNDTFFRMLDPGEVQLGMAFARDYQVLGNRREVVRQLGNAVTPPAARDLIAVVAEALTGEPVTA